MAPRSEDPKAQQSLDKSAAQPQERATEQHSEQGKKTITFSAHQSRVTGSKITHVISDKPMQEGRSSLEVGQQGKGVAHHTRTPLLSQQKQGVSKRILVDLSAPEGDNRASARRESAGFGGVGNGLVDGKAFLDGLIEGREQSQGRQNDTSGGSQAGDSRQFDGKLKYGDVEDVADALADAIIMETMMEDAERRMAQCEQLMEKCQHDRFKAWSASVVFCILLMMGHAVVAGMITFGALPALVCQ